MVDAIVSFAVEKLGDFLIKEAVFLHGVKNEVVWLQNELRWMRSFLKDAEQKQDGDERIRMWVTEIRDIAYSSEDLIDTFILEAKVSGTSKSGSLRTYVKKCFCVSTTKADVYDLGKEIEVLKKRVLDVSRKIEIYGISNIVDAQEGTSRTIGILRHLRRTTSYADDEHVIGFEDDVRLLEAKLFSVEQGRAVISILGMGGLGKTTLARKLYNKNSMKFACHSWICVSQEWSIRDLLGRMIKSFKKLTRDQLEEMSDEDLERCMRELLEGQRYLVVIDDVWHREAWESLKRALPDNKNGSRIIITTRIEKVAELSDHRTYVHKLKFLSEEGSWELFCLRAFPDYNASEGNAYYCPPDIEKLGKEMVAKCDGLPLAIIVLGGLLSRKHLHEWPVVKDHIWRELRDNSIHISSLLDLSFNDLPHQLKSCFLYLGLYPEDFVLNAERLMRLWIAEGFIAKGDGRLNMEEVADDYLNELIGRSLIQVVKRNWRMISTCRVHDLLRDLAVNKARELNFLHFYDEIINSTPSTIYRLAIRSGIQRQISDHHPYPSVRTLLFFNKDIYSMEQFVCTRFKLLRVLNLEGVQFISEKILPDAVGKLIHLRYLGLQDTSITALPESIGNLQALETLDASIYMKTRLPKEICKLKQLRHLKGYFEVSFPLFKELTNLQTLKLVEIGRWYCLDLEEMKSSLNPIANLRNLQFFAVVSRANMLSIQPLLHCWLLVELRINGSIENLPVEMHKFLPNLKYLELHNSGLKNDPIPTLEMLPNLVVLRISDFLRNKSDVKALIFTANGFPSLQVLWLTDEYQVRVKVQEGAMPRLRALSCGNISSLPKRLISLPAVEHLNWEWERQVSIEDSV